MNEFFLLMKDLDMNLHSDLEPIGVAVKSENEAIQFIENGRNRSQRRGYQKIKIIDKYSEPVIRRICKMNIELEKFITDLDEHLKKIQLSDDDVMALSKTILSLKITDCLGNCISDIIKDEKELYNEIKMIVQGARANMIYEYQAFVENFVKKEEAEEDENID